MQDDKTIVALSSGMLPSGVAVLRISGTEVNKAVTLFCGVLPPPRVAKLVKIVEPHTSNMLDQAIVLYFPAPNSFTGEDCAEFHLHGGKAVVSAFLNHATRIKNIVLAEPGEFTRRAYMNGKLDLTGVEALSDLINSETDMQRQLALGQFGGALRDKAAGWREELIKLRSYIEAEIDFADEDDIPGSVSDQVWQRAVELGEEIENFLDDGGRGEIIRDGFRVALLGPPNAGKSSLLNALAKRDVAIVTDVPGTTRDILEVKLDIGGVPVIFGDTAGQRDASNKVEKIGIERAREYASNAHLVVWMDEDINAKVPDKIEIGMRLATKRDLHRDIVPGDQIEISMNDAGSISGFLSILSDQLAEVGHGDMGSAMVTRKRQRDLFLAASDKIKLAGSAEGLSLEIRAEYLREASGYLGKITGSIDVENLLDHIFSEFCVGK